MANGAVRSRSFGSAGRYLLTCGTIYRHAWDDRPAEAMLVDNGRISWSGARGEAPAADRVIDLGGGTVLPGMTDAHVHLLAVGQARQQVSAIAPDIRSLDDYLQRLTSTSQGMPAGAWLFGGDVNEQLWPEKRMPDRAALDAAVPDRPVLLRRFCGHVAMLNSAALQALNLNAESAGTAGVDFDRDGGAPTGIARERAAEFVFRAAPRPPDRQIARATRQVINDLSRLGVTAAVDAAVGFTFGFEPEWNFWQLLHDEGDLPLRLGFMAQIDPATAKALSLAPVRDPWWQLCTLKIFVDGIIGARTAAMSRRYHDTDGSGYLMHEPAEIRKFVQAGHDQGWQIAAHAIGDLAIDAIMDAIAAAQSGRSRNGLRHRIEHFGLPDPSAFRRAADLGVLVATQPSFISRMGDSWPIALGDRHHRCFPALSLIEAGLCLAGSSDAPTGELSPWAGIQSFVTRRAASGQPSGPHEALSVRQAIHAYTSGGAIAMGHDAWRGTLHTGMAADFALLDRDPLSCSVDDLASITARLTVADGRAMHDPDGIL